MSHICTILLFPATLGKFNWKPPTCEACPKDCVACEEDLTCTKCAEGKSLEDGKCVFGLGTENQPGKHCADLKKAGKASGAYWVTRCVLCCKYNFFCANIMIFFVCDVVSLPGRLRSSVQMPCYCASVV